MVVVAVIALLAGIAIPVLVRARINANESSAIQSLRTISTACEMFRTSQTPPTYPDDLAALATGNLWYMDPVLAAGAKQGYGFAYTQLNANQFICIATPLSAGSGTRTFFLDESGVIRLNNAAGPPIE